jgi:hypothetical protein
MQEASMMRFLSISLGSFLAAVLILSISSCASDPSGSTKQAKSVNEDVLATAGHPAPGHVVMTGKSPATPVVASEPATGEADTLLAGPTAVIDEGQALLGSYQGGAGWAVYEVGSADAVASGEVLALNFERREGTIWIGFPDATRSSWEWQQLPAGEQLSVELPGHLRDSDPGDIFFSLVVQDGSRAIFTGGELVVGDGSGVPQVPGVGTPGDVVTGPGDPDQPDDGDAPQDPPQPPDLGTDPGDGDDDGDEPEAPPQPPDLGTDPGEGGDEPEDPGDAPEDPAVDTPEVISTYISHGYWDIDAVETTFDYLAGLGVNLVIDYALTVPDSPEWQDEFDAYMDAAETRGIGIAFAIYPPLVGMDPTAPGTQLEDVVALVDSLKDETAITAWYVHDEILPMISGDAGTTKYSISLDQMAGLYDSIKAADPSRPQLSVWNFLPDHALFNLVYADPSFTPYGRAAWMDDAQLYEAAMARMLQETCDWVLIDSYPIGAPWLDGSTTPEQEIGYLTSRANSLKTDTQPLMFVFQSFSWEQYIPGAEEARFPTETEMLDMIAAAYTNGAEHGVAAYSWFDLMADGREAEGRLVAAYDLQDVLTGLSTSGWEHLSTGVASVPTEHTFVQKHTATSPSSLR